MPKVTERQNGQMSRLKKGAIQQQSMPKKTAAPVKKVYAEEKMYQP